MKARNSLLLFGILSLIHILAEYYEWRLGIYLTKPVLVPLLLYFFLNSTKERNDRFKQWLMWALIFSWIGDFWLMLGDGLFFMLGLGSFFIAQVLYILAFGQRHPGQDMKTKSWFFDLILVFPLIIYYIFLMLDLIPNMIISEEHGGLVIPVVIYGLAITLMTIRATTRYQRVNKSSYIYILVGAILFLSSDSLIAFNKFADPIEMSRVYIMLTYLLAQYLIAKGGVEFYRED